MFIATNAISSVKPTSRAHAHSANRVMNKALGMAVVVAVLSLITV